MRSGPPSDVFERLRRQLRLRPLNSLAASLQKDIVEMHYPVHSLWKKIKKPHFRQVSKTAMISGPEALSHDFVMKR